jgi:hypothetical protein
MAEADTNKTDSTGGAQTPAKSRLLNSDAPASSAPTPESEQKYYVDGESVSREAYMEALPKAGYVPERMPDNFYPAISTK